MNKDQAHVKATLDTVGAYCEGAFADAFPMMPGERSSEFLDFMKIEIGLDGSRRARMFCCDPVKPGQRGTREKNHVELRKILPKRTDFDVLTFDSSHVNPHPKPGQRGSPSKTASLTLPKTCSRASASTPSRQTTRS